MAAEDNGVVLYEKKDRIVTITLNKPETRNALSGDLCEALVAAIEKADGDSDISCVVLAANGKSFCAGGNLKEIKADRKSTRLNSSHDQISYAVFCLKKKKIKRFDRIFTKEA